MTAAKKDNGGPRVVTKIDGNRVKMSRKDWDAWVAMTDAVLGLELHDLAPGKGTVTIALEVWCFLLSVLKEAVEYSGIRARGRGCEECCEKECKGLGGCDFCYGSAGVCNGGDLVFCGAV